jgi:hypothetical protein
VDRDPGARGHLTGDRGQAQRNHQSGLESNLDRLGAETNAGSPRDFAVFIAARKWGAIITSAGVKLD